MRGVVDRRTQQLREQRPRVGVRQRAVLDTDRERGGDVVARRALLRLEQLVGEASQVAERLTNIAHHGRIAGERLQRDRRPVRELGSAFDVAADHPTEDRRRDSGGDVGHELAVRPRHRIASSRSPTRSAVCSRSVSIRRGVNQGDDDPPEVLVITAFGAEQGPRTLRRRTPSGLARRIISKMPGRNAGSSSERVAPGVREHSETVRRAHDPRFLAHRSQLPVWIGRERIGGVVEEGQLTRRYRHAAAAYRSTLSGCPGWLTPDRVRTRARGTQ